MKKEQAAITICSYLSMLSYGLTVAVVGSLLGSIEKTYHVSSGDIGLLFTLQSLGFVLAVLFAGYFVDRLSLKPVGIFGQAALSIGLAWFASSKALPTGLAAYFLIGLGGGVLQIVTNTAIASTYTSNRASSLNLLHLFFGIGCLTGPVFGGLCLQNNIEWNGAYSILFVYSALVTGLYVFIKFPQKARQDPINLRELGRVFMNRYTILLCLAIFFYIGVEMGTNSWAIIYMEKNIGMSTMTASAMLSYFWMALTFGRFICIYLSKKLPPQLLLFLLSLGATGAYCTFLNTSNTRAAGISFVFVGLVFSGIFPTLLGLGSNKFPETIGSITGIMMTFLGIGFMIFPWAVGVIKDHYSLNHGMWLLWTLSLGLAVTAFLIFLETRKED